MAGRNEKKNITKSKIVNYIINNKITSKAELAQNLSLSMPTVLSNVNELIDRNMVIEIGEYDCPELFFFHQPFLVEFYNQLQPNF